MDKVRRIIKPILLACVVFSITALSGQQRTQKKSLFSIKNKNTIAPACFSDEIHDRLMLEDAEYRLRHENLEKQLASAIKSGESNRSEILTVPLVIHVIHTGEAVGVGSNISDAQIYSAVDALNEDFRKVAGTNGDGDRPDCQIEFCLAVRDPDGNPTSGINRVNGSSVPLYAQEGIAAGNTGDGANEQQVKALSKWSRWDYYNIWIVNEIADNDGGGGIQGFAYFPTAGPTVDGSVIMFNAFGTVGNLKSYTDMNRTTTHELGHALNLYHTFEGNSCSESDCTSQGDRVCDTPPTSNTGNCSSPACSGTQQVENYMDYTSQTCKNMYSEGQKTRMRTALINSRSTLLTSDACVPVSLHDVGIDQLTNPQGNLCSGNTAPVVMVRNFGGNTVTSMNIQYTVDGVLQPNFTFSGSIASGEVESITLPNINVGEGSHTIQVSTSLPNGQVDEFPSNDSASSDFAVVSGSTITVTFQQDTYGSDNTWTLEDDNGNILSQGGPYLSGTSGTVHTTDICVAEGCYVFKFNDSFGDGLLGAAYYEVIDSNQGIVASGDDGIGAQETTSFCLTGGTTGEIPVAQFTSSIQTICAGEAVNFTDLSTGSPTSWAWTFQGATNTSSSNKNPAGITYETPGTYSVTLVATNNSGSDTEVKSGYITVGQGATINGSVADVSCFGENDGQIVLTAGGQSPFVYSWSTGMTTPTLNGVSAGTYSVLVTDANGCEAMSFYNVGEPSEIQISIANISADIDNASIGGASINITGGNSPYVFSWSNGSTGSSISNVVAGTYSVEVTDANGCNASLSLVIANEDSNSSAPPVANFMVNDQELCAGSTVNFTDISSNTPDSWAWTFPGGVPNASSNKNPSDIRYDQPGVYDVTLTVTNANGSDTKTTMNYIHTVASPNLVANVNDVSCYNMSDGSIDLGIVNPSGSYIYSWSNGGSFEDINTLTAGTYDVQVTDNNGCVSVSSFTVQQPAEIELSVIDNQPDSCGFGQGQVTVIAQGGSPDYTMAWNDPALQDGFTLMNVTSGFYTGTVTDLNACSASVSIEIEEVDCEPLGIDDLSAKEIQIYPNPFDGSEIYLKIEDENSSTIEIFDITGSAIPFVKQTAGQDVYLIRPVSTLPNGIYMLKVIDGADILVKKIVVKH